MRWTWLVPRLILMTLLWAAVAFGLDPWLRSAATSTVQSITGARADIESVRTGFFPPVVSVGPVALARADRPGINLLEFESLKGRLGGEALLRKSFVIEEASLTGVRLGTVRNDDGQLQPLPDAPPAEPSWLTEKLKQAGSEWLDDLVQDVQGQLDPNTLESWRTGQLLKEKYSLRMATLRQQLESFEPRVKALQRQQKEAEELKSVARVERYLQLARDAEALLREANQLQQQLQQLQPEVQQDFRSLDAARQRDQQMVVQKVRQLSPSPRRITESLIGPQLYAQVHEALSWLEFGRSYQKQMKQQTQVERHRGRDFEFELQNPTPGFWCRKLSLSGELSLNGQLAPFEAILSDISSQPSLVSQPSEFRLHTKGGQPLQLAMRYDARQAVPVIQLAAHGKDPDSREITAGADDKAQIHALLSQLEWTARLQVVEQKIHGTIGIHSGVHSADVKSSELPGTLQSAVSSALTSIEQLDAEIRINGTLQAPELQISSAFGQQVADGLQTALADQVQQLRTRLSGQVQQLVAEQKQKLVADLGEKYRELAARHQQTVQQVQGAQKLLAAVRQPPSNPGDLFRQVSESGVLQDAGILPRNSNSKTRQVQQQLDQSGQLLQELGGRLFR